MIERIKNPFCICKNRWLTSRYATTEIVQGKLNFIQVYVQFNKITQEIVQGRGGLTEATGHVPDQQKTWQSSQELSWWRLTANNYQQDYCISLWKTPAQEAGRLEVDGNLLLSNQRPRRPTASRSIPHHPRCWGRLTAE